MFEYKVWYYNYKEKCIISFYLPSDSVGYAYKDAKKMLDESLPEMYEIIGVHKEGLYDQI